MDNNSQRGGNTGLPFKVLEPVAPVEPTDQKPRTHLRALVLKKLTREELEAIDQKEHEWGAMGRDTFPYALVLMNRKQFAANAAVPDLVLAAGDQVKDQVKDLIVSAIKAEKEDLKDSLTQFAQVLEAGKSSTLTPDQLSEFNRSLADVKAALEGLKDSQTALSPTLQAITTCKDQLATVPEAASVSKEDILALFTALNRTATNLQVAFNYLDRVIKQPNLVSTPVSNSIDYSEQLARIENLCTPLKFNFGIQMFLFGFGAAFVLNLLGQFFHHSL
jgi:hypothetical protein